MQIYCGWCGSGNVFNSTKCQTNVFFATGFVRRERGSNKIVYMWVSSNDGEIVTMHTPQQSKQISLGNEHVCVETKMRQCQEN